MFSYRNVRMGIILIISTTGTRIRKWPGRIPILEKRRESTPIRKCDDTEYASGNGASKVERGKPPRPSGERKRRRKYPMGGIYDRSEWLVKANGEFMQKRCHYLAKSHHIRVGGIELKDGLVVNSNIRRVIGLTTWLKIREVEE